MRCHYCQHDNRPEAKFCENCGALQNQLICPSCDHNNSENNKFCEHCGHEIVPPATHLSAPETADQTIVEKHTEATPRSTPQKEVPASEELESANEPEVVIDPVPGFAQADPVTTNTNYVPASEEIATQIAQTVVPSATSAQAPIIVVQQQKRGAPGWVWALGGILGTILILLLLIWTNVVIVPPAPQAIGSTDNPLPEFVSSAWNSMRDWQQGNFTDRGVPAAQPAATNQDENEERPPAQGSNQGGGAVAAPQGNACPWGQVSILEHIEADGTVFVDVHFPAGWKAEEINKLPEGPFNSHKWQETILVTSPSGVETPLVWAGYVEPTGNWETIHCDPDFDNIPLVLNCEMQVNMGGCCIESSSKPQVQFMDHEEKCVENIEITGDAQPEFGLGDGGQSTACSENISNPSVVPYYDASNNLVVILNASSPFQSSSYNANISSASGLSADYGCGVSQNDSSQMVCTGSLQSVNAQNGVLTLSPMSESCAVLEQGFLIPGIPTPEPTATSDRDSCPAGQSMCGGSCCSDGHCCNGGCFQSCP